MHDSHTITDSILVSDIFGSPRRNRVLRVLLRDGTPMTLETLAGHVAGPKETDTTTGGDVFTAGQTAAVLHHTHLPRLDDAGIIWYDREEQVVLSLDQARLNALLQTAQELLAALQTERPEQP